MYVDPEGKFSWRHFKIGLSETIKSLLRECKEALHTLRQNAYDFPIKVGETIAAIIENMQFEMGIGLGIGFDFKIHGFAISAIMKGDFFSLGIDKDGIRLGGLVDISAGATLAGVFEAFYGFEEFCGYKDIVSEKRKKKMRLTVGGGTYIIFGANISLGIDWTTIKNEWIDIWR